MLISREIELNVTFQSNRFRPSKLVHGLAFGTPKFYIAPYDKINHGLIYLSYICDMKSGFREEIYTSGDVCSHEDSLVY